MKPKFKPNDKVHYVTAPDVEALVLNSFTEVCCGGTQITYLVRPVHRRKGAYGDSYIHKDQYRVFEFEIEKGWEKIEIKKDPLYNPLGKRTTRKTKVPKQNKKT